VRRSLRLALILAATLAAFLALTAAASAASNPVVIRSGPGEGVILHPESTTLIVGADRGDKLLGAKGFIAGAAPDCPFQPGHYHGTLFGKPDPAPDACGWGPIIGLDQLTDVVQDITQLITRETYALRRKTVSRAKKDLGKASSSMGAISNIREDLQDSSIPQDRKDAMSKLIDEFVKQDHVAIKHLDKAAAAKTKKGRERRKRLARRRIRKALEAKRAFLGLTAGYQVKG
jgi:hypothetical protein